MTMYDLLQYSSNYSDTTGSLGCYSKDEATNFNADIGDSLKSFMYKAKLVGETETRPSPNNNNEILKNATTAVPSK